jgi:formate transporter FocA
VNPQPPQPFDALPPPQIAAKAEDAGAAKAKLDLLSLFVLGVLAGAFIAMGAAFSTVVMTGTEGRLPWGVARLLGGLAFCLGLILVIVGGAELFTGNNLLVMALVSRKLSLWALLRNWAVVYLGNFVGSVLTAVLMFFSAQYSMAQGQVGATVLRIADAKCSLTFAEAFTRGIYCNALVCLAVWLCLSGRSVADRILSILFPITAFVAAGFEHSVANMYFIPIGLLVKHGAASEFWRSIGISPSDFGALNTPNFFLVNLLPVTIGNIVGGSLFVGLVYWVVYRRNAAA